MPPTRGAAGAGSQGDSRSDGSAGQRGQGTSPTQQGRRKHFGSSLQNSRAALGKCPVLTSDSTLLSFLRWKLTSLSLGARAHVVLWFTPYRIDDRGRLLYKVTEKRLTP